MICSSNAASRTLSASSIAFCSACVMRRESAMALSTSSQRRVISARSKRPHSASSSRNADSTAPNSASRLADCCKALPALCRSPFALHCLELRDGLCPHLPVILEIWEQAFDAHGVLLHVRHHQLVMPELVHAEQISRHFAAELHVQRSHQQRKRALCAQQGFVYAFDVVALILQFLQPLRRREHENVENLDDQIFFRCGRDRRFEVLLFGRTFHQGFLLTAAVVEE